MKLLVLAALVAIAVAKPMDGLVVPGAAGPAPIIPGEFHPIAIGPAVIDSFEPVPIPTPKPKSPLVQLIVNVNAAGLSPVTVPAPELPYEPVNIVEAPIQPAEPVIVGTPILPVPIVNPIDELN